MHVLLCTTIVIQNAERVVFGVDRRNHAWVVPWSSLVATQNLVAHTVLERLMLVAPVELRRAAADNDPRSDDVFDERCRVSHV